MERVPRFAVFETIHLSHKMYVVDILDINIYMTVGGLKTESNLGLVFGMSMVSSHLEVMIHWCFLR